MVEGINNLDVAENGAANANRDAAAAKCFEECMPVSTSAKSAQVNESPTYGLDGTRYPGASESVGNHAFSELTKFAMINQANFDRAAAALQSAPNTTIALETVNAQLKRNGLSMRIINDPNHDPRHAGRPGQILTLSDREGVIFARPFR